MTGACSCLYRKGRPLCLPAEHPGHQHQLPHFPCHRLRHFRPGRLRDHRKAGDHPVLSGHGLQHGTHKHRRPVHRGKKIRPGPGLHEGIPSLRHSPPSGAVRPGDWFCKAPCPALCGQLPGYGNRSRVFPDHGGRLPLKHPHQLLPRKPERHGPAPPRVCCAWSSTIWSCGCRWPGSSHTWALGLRASGPQSS